MNSSTVSPCFYYPTTAVFLDDNQAFLNKISLELDEKLPYQLFTDPQQALSYIKENNHAKQLMDEVLSASTDSPDYGVNPRHCETKLDLSILLKQLYNPKRFSEATILVIDYAMPDMDGLTFCKQLEGLPIKKILLTGEADEVLAVEAFNSGLIDQFVTKNSSNFGKKVNDTIRELQQEYFREWSSLILKNLLVQEDCVLSHFRFVVKFYEICKTHNIAEYYVLENSGSFLLFDASGKPFFLIAATPSMLQDYYLVAQDHNAPQEVVEQLKHREAIAYFLDGENFMETEGEAWEQHIFPAEILSSLTTVYYALLEDIPFFPLDKAKILPLNQYLDKA